MKDDDNESGRGASLPQSPVTVEAESQESSDTRSHKKPASKCVIKKKKKKKLNNYLLRCFTICL
jgi:hypothetical protein